MTLMSGISQEPGAHRSFWRTYAGRTRAGTLLVIALLLAACGASEVAPLPSQPPSPPADWVILSTDEGDVRLVVPPDVGLVHAAAGELMGQPGMRDGVIPFEVTALGPGQLTPAAPVPGQSVFEYLQHIGYLPQASEGVVFAETVEREVMLPAGRAFEVRTSVQPGTTEEGRAVIYLIETETGFALLRFVGTAAGMEERSGDMDLISQLADFGEPD